MRKYPCRERILKRFPCVELDVSLACVIRYGAVALADRMPSGLHNMVI